MAARWNPRTGGINTGYAIGDALVQLAPMLRQGFVDYERQQTIDEESGRRDQDMALRLRQLLGMEEDRDLDRAMKMEQMYGQREDRGLARQDRLAGQAASAAQGRGRAKFWSALTGGQAPPTDLAPDEVSGDLITALQRHFESQKAKEPKAPEPFTLGPGQRRFDPMGGVVAEVPDRPEKPEKPESPSAERTILGAARAALVKSGLTDPTEDQIFEKAVEIKERLGKAGATTIKLGAEERKDERLAVNTEVLGTKILRLIEQHPDWIGGALGYKGRTNSVRAMLDMAPKGFADFESDLDKMTADMVNILAGAALSENEERRYLRSIPKVTDSTQKFQSNLRITIANARRLREYIQRRERGETLAPPPPVDDDAGPAGPPPGFTPRTP